jgi:hypothetical protein
MPTGSDGIIGPKIWREQTWLLYHDNAPSHTSVLTQQFLAKNKIAVIPHRQYSPDLAPCDFLIIKKNETTSRVTVADRPYGEFYDFYSVSLENFGYPY